LEFSWTADIVVREMWSGGNLKSITEYFRMRGRDAAHFLFEMGRLSRGCESDLFLDCFRQLSENVLNNNFR
jgi:hypothetical protein